MRLIQNARQLQPGARKVCLAIGFFDGVHLGHQQIIRTTITDASRLGAVSLAVTFARHPNAVVAPNDVPPLIYSLPQKLRAIESLGTEVTLLLPFDTSFSRQTGEQFIRQLAADLGPLRSICVGADFVFGHKRSGDVKLLKQIGAELQFSVHGMAAVALDDQPVSSTRIRERIRAGDLDQASQMLGRPYSLAGTVVPGDGLGHKLGFPTANIDTTGLALPPEGVYAVLAQTGSNNHRAVLNIGRRPTLNEPQPQLRVEAHLLDFHGELRGQELEVVFVEKLREEKKFSNLKGLRDQIARDILQALMKF